MRPGKGWESWKIGKKLSEFKNLSIGDWRYVLEGLGIVLALGQLFYGRWWAGILLSPGIFLYYRERKKGRRRAELNLLKDGFKECLLVVMAAVNVGYSLENAWRNAHKDLMMLLGKDHPMTREADMIRKRLDLNEPLEKVLGDWGHKCGIEEVDNFCQVMQFAKRSGGNFGEIMNNTILQISEKLEVEREIQTITAGKRMEQRIMLVIPMGIIAYLRIGSGDYLKVMYESSLGLMIMTVSLLACGAAYYLSEKVVNIAV